eukprot:TRINITY_DN548_c0_g2_i1.p1 TRINITY_DN548_c0_g2~~TRINITY_DN548_c0_g2_i1.p1  ORF type:complete len:339 (+),score=53.48 TRINITY_DN548_c0_g2_i1:105-1121(+)
MKLNFAPKKSSNSTGSPKWSDSDAEASRMACIEADSSGADSSGASILQSFGRMSLSLASQTEGVKKNLASFWDKNEKAFSKFWLELPVQQQKQLLRTVTPFMPKSVMDPWVDGEKMTGIIALAPEMTLENLTKDGGQGLLDLLKHRVSTDMFDIMWETRAFIERQLQLGRLVDDRDPLKFTYFYDDKAGQSIRVKHPKVMPDIKRWVENGFLWPANVYTLSYEREDTILKTLGLVVDEYRSMVKNKNDFKMLSAAAGCFNCGETNRPSGKPLLACSECRLAYYCSKECQRGDWKEHKEACKRERKRKEGVSGSVETPTTQKDQDNKEVEKRAVQKDGV